jgi:hypothetical protein
MVWILRLLVEMQRMLINQCLLNVKLARLVMPVLDLIKILQSVRMEHTAWEDRLNVTFVLLDTGKLYKIYLYVDCAVKYSFQIWTCQVL